MPDAASPAGGPPQAPATPKALWGLVLAYGAGTLVSQVLILRELLVLGQGSELKLALGLWGWLLWVGLGSLWGGRRGWKGQEDHGAAGAQAGAGPRRLAGLLALLGLLLPATVLLIRALPGLGVLPWGQSLPLTTALWLFLALLAPFGLVSGYFFPLACRVLTAPGAPEAPSRVYYLETLGAALGVLLLQLLLLGRFSDLGLSLALGLLMALSPWVLARPRGGAGRLAAAAPLLLLAAALVFLPRLETASRAWQWPGRRVLAVTESPYARLTATREAEQVSFFANHLWQFTFPDPLTEEHQVEFGMLEHPRPRRVLLLGGGPGLVPEVLKHPGVTRLTYVELDPKLVHLALGLLPEAAAAARDPRLQIIYQDARRFLTTSKSPYDVILMALPEPKNAQLNRFYTREFFQIVAARLAPGGVFSFALTGAAAGLNPTRAAYLAMTYHTLGRVFPQVLVFPGERARFLAAAAPDTLVAAPETLVARLKARHLELKYVRGYYLLSDLSQARQKYLRGILAGLPPEINTDLTPGCYFYDLMLSAVQEGLPASRLFLALQGLPPALPWAGAVSASLLLGLLLRRRPAGRYLYQVTVMGLGAMALEILVLILYQIQFGHLYRQLGLLIAAFMAGMAGGAAAGGALAARWRGAPWAGGRLLAGLQGGLGLLAGLLALWLHRGPAYPWPEFLVQGAYALVLAAGGAAGGGIFALVAALWAQEEPGVGRAGGLLYAADLLGATLGTLGLSLLILPVWGILPALYLVAALHVGAAGLFLGGRRSQPA
jgi:spermidine synthase